MKTPAWLGRIGLFFRHGSNLAIVATLCSLGALLAAWPAETARWPYVLVGLALFPGIEYVFHRWILHMRPVGRGRIYALQCRTHYDHHREPDRVELLFTPLFAYAPLVAVTGLVYFAATRSLPLTIALLAGSLIGYLHYEWVHFVAHQPGTPRTPWGRYLKKYHQWHHYKNEHYWYGVTSPLVDMLMGTYRRVEDVDKSSTTRQLYEAPRR